MLETLGHIPSQEDFHCLQILGALRRAAAQMIHVGRDRDGGGAAEAQVGAARQRRRPGGRGAAVGRQDRSWSDFGSFFGPPWGALWGPKKRSNIELKFC